MIQIENIQVPDVSKIVQFIKGEKIKNKSICTRMIDVTMDITAPLYWWGEFYNYKIETVTYSCSPLHKIAEKEFTLNDFSYEHLCNDELALLEEVIFRLNMNRVLFIAKNDKQLNQYTVMSDECYVKYKKTLWKQMLQLIPSSYNQKKNIKTNYEELKKIYCAKQNSNIDEWASFCQTIKKLPYFEELCL